MKYLCLVSGLVWLTGCDAAFDDAQCHALKIQNGNCDRSGPDGGPENSTVGDGGFLVASADHFDGPLPDHHVIVISDQTGLTCPPKPMYPARSVVLRYIITPQVDAVYACAAPPSLICEVDGQLITQGSVTVHQAGGTTNTWKGHFSNFVGAGGSFDGDFAAPTTACGP